ncbi:hypothetical protein GGF31_003919 [Allomyces arbusculus]|nr:hypothetical protein GGF31_003919 [Allomyces arbusculus]
MTATSATTHAVPGTLADLGPAGAHQPPHQCAQPDLQLGSLDRALDFLRKCKARVASPSDVAATAKPAAPVVAVAPQPIVVGGAHECDHVATPKPGTPRSATPRTDALRAALALPVPRLACPPPSDPAIFYVVGPAVAPAAADPAPARAPAPVQAPVPVPVQVPIPAHVSGSAAAPRIRHPKLIPADRVPTGAVVKPVPALVPAAAPAAAKTTPPRAPRTRRRSHPAESTASAATQAHVHSSRHATTKPAALHIAPSTTVHSDSASTSAVNHRTPRSATSARHHRGSASDVKPTRHGVPVALASPTSPTFMPTKWTPAHPQTVHIFVDNSNILHGAQNLANQLPKQQRRALVPSGATLGLSYARLAKVITAMLDTVVAGHVHHATCPAACLPVNASTTPSTSTRSMLRRAAMPRSIDEVMALRAQIPKCTCGVGGMPAHYYQIVKKVLVASRPLVQDLRDAQALAFETLVLDRVYNRRGNAGRSPSSSGSSSAGTASDDWSGMESDTSTRASDYSGMKGRTAASAAPQPAAQPSLDLQAILNAFRLAAAAKKNGNNGNINNNCDSNTSINNGHATEGSSSAQHRSATTTKSTSTASSSSTSLAATTAKRASSTASMTRTTTTTKRVAATTSTTPSSSAGGGRGKEMFVDELLHVKMADSMLDYDRGILILLTGDGAVAQFTDGFGAQVARALRRGWTVIVASFAACLSSVYGKLAKQAAAAAAMAEAEGAHAGGSLHLFVLDADVANLVCVV